MAHFLIAVVGIGTGIAVLAVSVFYFVARRYGVLGGLLEAYPKNTSSEDAGQELQPPAYSSIASDTLVQLTGGGNLGDGVVCAPPVYTGSPQKREESAFRVLAGGRVLKMMTQSIGEQS